MTPDYKLEMLPPQTEKLKLLVFLDRQLRQQQPWLN